MCSVQCGNVRVHCDNANASCALTIFHCSFIALVNFSFEQFVLYLNATFAAAVATCDILSRASAHTVQALNSSALFFLWGVFLHFSLFLFLVCLSLSSNENKKSHDLSEFFLLSSR